MRRAYTAAVTSRFAPRSALAALAVRAALGVRVARAAAVAGVGLAAGCGADGAAPPSSDAPGVPSAGAPDAGAPPAPDAAAPTPPPPGILPRWQARAPLDEVRQETAVVAFGGEVWVLGGFGAGAAVSARVDVYDPRTDRWRPGPSLPEPMHHANVAVVGGSIVVAGSLRGAGFTADGRTYVLAPPSTTWTPRTVMPAGTERGGALVAALDGKVVVAGGLRGGAVPLVSAYDVAADRWEGLPSLPTARDHGAGVVVEGTFFAVGGRGGALAAHTAEVLALDVAAGAWRARAPMPTSRAGIAAAVRDGKVVVFGGEGNGGASTGVFADVELYDPARDAWTRLPPMPSPRHGMGAATAVDATGVAFVHLPGGGDRQGLGAVAHHDAFAF